jgi:hypothetical protein
METHLLNLIMANIAPEWLISHIFPRATLGSSEYFKPSDASFACLPLIFNTFEFIQPSNQADPNALGINFARQPNALIFSFRQQFSPSN